MFPNEKDCLKLVDTKTRLLSNEKSVVFDFKTKLLHKIPSVSFEKKLLFPNEKDCLKPIDAKTGLPSNGKIFAIDVETKSLHPGNRECVNSIETCFDFEIARARDITGSDAGWGGPVEGE